MRTRKTYAHRPLWRYGALALSIFLIDQYTKSLCVRLLEKQSYAYGPLAFSLVYNTGAAFGLFHNHPWLLYLLIPLVSIIITTLIFHSLNPISMHDRIGYTCILAGAGSNYFDRIIHGHVIDFLTVQIGSFSWPAFNIADTAICIGVAYILYGAYAYKTHQNN